MNVLVVAAHPDDEILGCGGTLARHVAEGDRVQAVILAEGATARGGSRDELADAADIEVLRLSACAAAKAIGAEPPRFEGLPDNRLDGLDRLDIIKRVETAFADLQPAVIYTHFGGDLNIDHRITSEAVLAACRPLPNATVHAVYAFETVSSTEWAPASAVIGFQPTHFVDIAAYLQNKREALGCYDTEMRAFPHSRSIEALDALARWRGASVGREAAEAFMLLREVR